MYFEDVLKKISEPIDISIFLLSFSLAYIIHTIFFNNTIPSGTVAGIAAIGIVGLKKGIESILTLNNGLFHKYRLKKRLSVFKNYFSYDVYVNDVINEFEKIMEANLIEYDKIDDFLNETLREFIDDEIDKSLNIKIEVKTLFDDFSKLLTMVDATYKNNDILQNKQLHSFCTLLVNRYKK